MNSRAKGKRGELEFASVLRKYGYEDARRGVQYHGGQDSPDVVGVEGVHFEVKRCEKTDLYAWVEQARRDAGKDLPVVVHRKNRGEWLAIMTVDDFMRLLNDGIHDTEVR